MKLSVTTREINNHPTINNNNTITTGTTPSTPTTTNFGASYSRFINNQESEMRLEKLLPLLIDYQITLSSSSFKHNSTNQSSQLNNINNNIYEGGKLYGNIIIQPSQNLFDLSQAIKFQQQTQQQFSSSSSSPITSFPSSSSSSSSNTSNVFSQNLNDNLFLIFNNYFNIKLPKDIHSSSEEYLPSNNLFQMNENQRKLLLKESKLFWKNLFSKLHIKTYISTKFPESVKPNTSTNSTATVTATGTGGNNPSTTVINSGSGTNQQSSSSNSSNTSTTNQNVSNNANSSTVIDIKYLNIDKNTDSSINNTTIDNIDFYVFKSNNFVAKQILNAQSIFMENVATEKINSEQEDYNDEDSLKLHFEFQLDIPFNDLNKNPYYIISEIFIPTNQFSEHLIKTITNNNQNILSDNYNNSFKINKNNLDYLIPYEISQQYIPSRIFLSALCKPIILRKALNLKTRTKLLNMKNFIQLTIENNSKNDILVIDKIELNLTNAKFVKYCNPNETQLELINNLEREDRITNNTSSTVNNDNNINDNNLNDNNNTMANSVLSIPPIGNLLNELFDSFINKEQLPIELKPLEQHTVMLNITPIYRNLDEVMNKSSSTDYLLNNTTINTNVNKNSTTTSLINNLILDDSLAQYKSKIEVTYHLLNNNQSMPNNNNAHNSKFKNWIECPWTAVLRRGLFASIRCDKPKVALMEPFTVSIYLSNFSESECDLILYSEPNAESSIICQDAQIDIGIVQPKQSTKVVLHYIGVQQGLHHMDLLFLFNKKTQQQFIFPFYIHTIVTKK
ncbi:hypothetical protein ABK040_010396 [Willaertia magna]